MDSIWKSSETPLQDVSLGRKRELAIIQWCS